MTGDHDGVARPDWHLPWLADRVGPLDVVTIRGAGHAPHHVEPGRIVEAIRAAAGRSRSRAAGPAPGWPSSA